MENRIGRINIGSMWKYTKNPEKAYDIRPTAEGPHAAALPALVVGATAHRLVLPARRVAPAGGALSAGVGCARASEAMTPCGSVPSSPASAASTSGSNAPDTKWRGRSRSTPSASASWPSDGPASSDGAMSEVWGLSENQRAELRLTAISRQL